MKKSKHRQRYVSRLFRIITSITKYVCMILGATDRKSAARSEAQRARDEILAMQAEIESMFKKPSGMQ